MTVLNKVDRLDRPRTVKALAAAAELGVPGELYPISAKTGDGVARRGRASSSRSCPRDRSCTRRTSESDQSLELRLAELIREQVLLRTREEVPHSVEVEIDEIEEREDGLLVVRARVWAETESQKGILVGAGGRMVRAVGTAARKEIEAALGRRVHLELQRARAQGLAPRRGPAGPPGNRVIERIHRFFRHAEEGVCDEVVKTAHGTALLTPSLPLVWQVNAIRVEDPDASPKQLAAEADEVQAALRPPQAGRARRAAGRPARAARSSARAGTSSAC